MNVTCFHYVCSIHVAQHLRNSFGLITQLLAFIAKTNCANFIVTLGVSVSAMASSSHRGMGTFANDSTGSGSQSIGEQHMDICTSQQFTPLTAEFRNTAAHAAQLAVDAVRNLSRSTSPMIAQPPGVR